MKACGIFVASLFGALGLAAPVNKRDVVWVTETAVDVVTVPVTMTVWAGSDATSTAAISTSDAAPTSAFGRAFAHQPKTWWITSTVATTVTAASASVASTSNSSSVYAVPTTSSVSVSVEPTTSSTSVYVAPTTSSVYVAPTTTSTSVYVAPTPSSTSVYVAPTTSSTSIYVAPTTSSTSIYVAPTTSSTSVYVAPTTTAAPTSTYVAPSTTSSAPAATSSSSSASGSGLAASGTSYTGDLTYYATGLGACGWTNTISDHIVAISHLIYDAPQYATANPNNNPLCGRYVSITGKDGSQYQAKVVDRCEGCATGDLDLSQDFFNTVTQNGDGRVHDITWTWV